MKFFGNFFVGFFWRIFLEEFFGRYFFGGLFLQDFFERIFFGEFFWEDQNYFNIEGIDCLSRFWFLSRFCLNAEERKEDEI